MRRTSAMLQGLVILAGIVMFSILMMEILRVPAKCGVAFGSDAYSAECLRDFPEYPPKRGN